MHEVDFQRIVLRSDRDSNSGYAFGVYTLSSQNPAAVSDC
jgi:hypothetical protein